MIYVLTGPTGVGKSALAVKLAEAVDGEIVNADAFQVYRELSIATAMPTLEERKQVPHHLYAYVSIEEGYDIHRYQKDARAVIEDILKRGKTPILVGGSGLYIRSALYDYDLETDASSVDLSSYEKLDDEELHKELERLDPSEAKKIHPHNRRRVMRAIALCLALGKPKSEAIASQNHQPIHPSRFFALVKERTALYPLVEERVERMFEMGLLEETLPLLKKYPKDLVAFQAIGVKELYPYLDGEKTLKETKETIKTHTRQYIKRQETFFRHQFPIEEVDGLEALLQKLEK